MTITFSRKKGNQPSKRKKTLKLLIENANWLLLSLVSGQNASLADLLQNVMELIILHLHLETLLFALYMDLRRTSNNI